MAKCYYCEWHTGTTRDHIIPRSRGGNNSAQNLVPCCKPCNFSKGSLLLSEWIGFLENYVQFNYRSSCIIPIRERSKDRIQVIICNARKLQASAPDTISTVPVAHKRKTKADREAERRIRREQLLAVVEPEDKTDYIFFGGIWMRVNTKDFHDYAA